MIIMRLANFKCELFRIHKYFFLQESLYLNQFEMASVTNEMRQSSLLIDEFGSDLVNALSTVGYAKNQWMVCKSGI